MNLFALWIINYVKIIIFIPGKQNIEFIKICFCFTKIQLFPNYLTWTSNGAQDYCKAKQKLSVELFLSDFSVSPKATLLTDSKLYSYSQIYEPPLKKKLRNGKILRKDNNEGLNLLPLRFCKCFYLFY